MATQVATVEDQTANVPALTAEGERFALRQRQARMFASSPLVPEHLRKGTPEQAIANCWIALTLAEAMGEVPLVVMQNIHIVSGKAGFASQYMIARANSSGIFKGRIDWRIEGSGDSLSVTAYAVLKETGQEVSVTCDMAMAKAEQWTRNAKYQSMPEVMLRYRSAAFLVRFYAPDVMLGYQTVEEVVDVALAATPVGPPLTAKMIETQALPATDTDLPPHDAATGEVVEDEPAAETAAEPEPEVETPADDAAEPVEVEADTNVNDQAEPEPTLEEDYGTAPAGQQTLLDEVTANPQQPGDDPAATKANEIIGELTAASSIAEITAVWGRNAGHLQAMEGSPLHAQLVQTKELRLAEIKAAPVA